MDFISGFFGFLFDALRGIWDSIVAVATFNPIAGLDSLNLSPLVAPVRFIGQFLPFGTFGNVVIGVLPMLLVAILIMILWRWVKSTNDGGE